MALICLLIKKLFQPDVMIVSEGVPDDHFWGDYGSTKSALKSERMIIAATHSSGLGSAQTGKNSGSADTPSSPMISPTRGDVGGNSGGATAGQQNPPLWEATMKALSDDRQVKTSFVDASAITVDDAACLGYGSYGKVHRGEYQGTPVAVKIIPDNPWTAHEFTIPGRLSHPNIVRMMAVAKTDTQILIANEYIHGANLHQVLYSDTNIKLQPEDKLSVALDVAMAVEYIHGKWVLHQDLKPANIMIAADNKKAYLTDWGKANLMETISMTRRTSQAGARYGGLFGGTPPYMAPECLVEFDDCSTMSDMWSLGITLLEMFTNSKPWSNSTIRKLRKLLQKQASPPVLSQLQPDLEDIVKPLIEYEPQSRMRAKDLVTLLKTKVDVAKRYGYKW